MTKFVNIKEENKLEIWLSLRGLHITGKSVLSSPLASLEFLNVDFFILVTALYEHQHNSTPIKISINKNILKHVKISLLYFRTCRGTAKYTCNIYFGLFPFGLENYSNPYVCHMRTMTQILQTKLQFQ